MEVDGPNGAGDSDEEGNDEAMLNALEAAMGGSGTDVAKQEQDDGVSPL